MWEGEGSGLAAAAQPWGLCQEAEERWHAPHPALQASFVGFAALFLDRESCTSHQLLSRMCVMFWCQGHISLPGVGAGEGCP